MSYYIMSVSYTHLDVYKRQEVMVYNKNNNNKLDVNKNGLCYKYVRYIHDDGG